METFGERLVLAREAKKLSQKTLAEMILITPTRLNYWEKDKREPDVVMIKELAKALDVTADYLIGNIKKAPAITLEPSLPAYELVKNFLNSSLADQDALLRFAEYAARAATVASPQKPDDLPPLHERLDAMARESLQARIQEVEEG